MELNSMTVESCITYLTFIHFIVLYYNKIDRYFSWSETENKIWPLSLQILWGCRLQIVIMKGCVAYCSRL